MSSANTLIESLKRHELRGDIIAKLSKLRSNLETVKELPTDADGAADGSTSSKIYGPMSKADMLKQCLTYLLSRILEFHEQSLVYSLQSGNKDKIDAPLSVKAIEFDNSALEYLISHVDHPELYELCNTIYSYPSLAKCAVFELDEAGQTTELLRLAAKGQLRIIRHLFLERRKAGAPDRQGRPTMLWKVRWTDKLIEQLRPHLVAEFLGELLNAAPQAELKTLKSAKKLIQAHLGAETLRKKAAKEADDKKAEVAAAAAKKAVKADDKVKAEDVDVDVAEGKEADGKEAEVEDLDTKVDESGKSETLAQKIGRLQRERKAAKKAAAGGAAEGVHKESCTTDEDHVTWGAFGKVAKECFSVLASVSMDHLYGPFSRTKTNLLSKSFWAIVRFIDTDGQIKGTAKDDKAGSAWWKRPGLPEDAELARFLREFWFADMPATEYDALAKELPEPTQKALLA